MVTNRRRWAGAVAVLTMAVSGLVGVRPVDAAGTTAALSSWNVKALPVPAHDVAYDATRDVLLATVPGTQPSIGNELVELDPETGQLGRRIFVGPDPTAIALTDDGAMAYVGLRGVNAITQVDLTTFTVVRSFPTSTDPFFGPRYVEDLEAVPGRNDVVAASLMKPGFSPRHEGVFVFDDGVRLPDSTQTHTGANRIEFGNATTLYGYNNETTEFGFRRIAVSSTGAQEVSSGSSAISGFGVDIELVAGLVYSTTGIVLDPATRAAVGSYGSGGLVEVTTSDNRTTFLDGATVRVFDRLTTAPLASRTFSGMTANSRSFVATGTGFAVASTDGVRLLGPAVAEGPVTLPPPPAATTGDLNLVSLPVRASDIVYDGARDRVYASVPGSAPSYANSIVSIDASSGAVVQSLFLGSDPGPLALTHDRSLLYVGQSATGRVQSVTLSTFTAGTSFSLGNASYSGALVAADIEVQPGTLSTLAVSLRNQCCSPSHEGVAIYDNGVRRSSTTPRHTGANRIEFSTSPTILYGNNHETTGFEFFNMAVSPLGVTRTKTTGYLLPGWGTDIELSDGLLYSSIGLVVDPDPATLVGRYNSAGPIEVDRSRNRTYIATDQALVEYVADRYTEVGRRSITFGSPRDMVGTSTGLVVATDTRTVVLTRAAVAVPAPVVSAVTPSSGSTSGAWVTIHGSGFLNATAVSFGGAAATWFSITSDAEISAQAPPRAAGSVTVAVTSPGGTAQLAGGFTYVGGSSPPPSTTTTTTTTTTSSAPPPPPPSSSGRLTVSRSLIDFEDQRVNTFDPDGQAFQVRNDSPGAIRLLGFEFLGDDSWDGATNCPHERALAPGEVCDVVLAFFPDSIRRFSGQLRVHGSSGAPADVRLLGQGSAGYFTATVAGGLAGFGDAWPPRDGVGGPLTRPVVGMATTPEGDGQWLVATDGGIFSFGTAEFFGSTGAMRLNQPIVGMASTPTGNGYWLVASDGGIFSFGDAEFFGSTGAMRLNKPIVGMASTPTGDGYWLVASDGGIFAFGDAPFHGSTGNLVLNQPIVGMASTGSGGGYWFVAADGGIFSFGDAKFFGSTGNLRLNQPIVGMAASPTARGYWFVARDGGVFSFGDAPFFGSDAPSPRPVAAMAGTAPVFSSDGLRAATTARRGGQVQFTEAQTIGSRPGFTVAASGRG